MKVLMHTLSAGAKNTNRRVLDADCMLRLQLLFAIFFVVLCAPSTANPAEELKARYADNPKPALSIIKLPAPLTAPDKEALKVIVAESVVPVSSGIFPQYRARTMDEDRLDVTAWSVADYKKYQDLSAQSESFRQLLAGQIMALAPSVGGTNINGAISQLRWRAAGVPADAQKIDIDGDNVDSLRKASSPTWQSVRNDFKNIRGNRGSTLDLKKLRDEFGEVESKKFIDKFSRMESEKGRPHEVWVFGLDDANGDNNWIDKLVLLKSKLKPFGYESFALDHTAKRKYFTDLNEAQSFARLLNPQVHAQLVQEGPGVLILDKNAAVVSVSGKVSKRELDAASKQRLASLNQVMHFANLFSGAGKFGAANFNAGMRFQFVNCPANWLPPQAKIEQLEDGLLKVSVPLRYSVCYAYHGAFAIKNYDQYHYLEAQGVNAINHGMSHKDVENHLKQLDRLYGLNVISAKYDGLTAKYLRLPSELTSLARQEQSFCPDMEESNTLNALKSRGIVDYWWD